jgi:HAD superfamily hydrolase (TIGR01509 family)
VTLDAIVFDFDGVIANSEPLHFRALQEVVAREGVLLTEAEYYGRYLGYDDLGALNAIAADRGIEWTPPHLAGLIRRKAARLEELERETSVLFPGAADAIRRLAGTVPLAIASGALRGEIVRVLGREGLTPLFAAVVAAEDTPASKPAPDPYLRAVDLLRAGAGRALHPASCVAIEDSRWGLQSAIAAGLRTVAITHTYPAESLSSADLIVGRLDELTVDLLTGIVAGEQRAGAEREPRAHGRGLRDRSSNE